MAKLEKNNKKIYKKDDNFYYGSTFTLQNLPCDFVIDTIHHTPKGPKTNVYKIGASDGIIKFAYETQKALIKDLSNKKIDESSSSSSDIQKEYDKVTSKLKDLNNDLVAAYEELVRIKANILILNISE